MPKTYRNVEFEFTPEDIEGIEASRDGIGGYPVPDDVADILWDMENWPSPIVFGVVRASWGDVPALEEVCRMRGVEWKGGDGGAENGS